MALGFECTPLDARSVDGVTVHGLDVSVDTQVFRERFGNAGFLHLLGKHPIRIELAAKGDLVFAAAGAGVMDTMLTKQGGADWIAAAGAAIPGRPAFLVRIDPLAALRLMGAASARYHSRLMNAQLSGRAAIAYGSVERNVYHVGARFHVGDLAELLR